MCYVGRLQISPVHLVHVCLELAPDKLFFMRTHFQSSLWLVVP